MESLLLNLYLYRSNPIMMRQVAVPDGFSFDELPVLACIIFGLDSSDCAYELSVDKHASDEESYGESSLLSGMSGTVYVKSSSVLSAIFTLEIRFDILKYESESESISHPLLKSWIGYHIPKDCFNISYINNMQSVFALKDCWLSPHGESYYRDLLQCKPDKVNNALCRRYAPDQVKPEVRTDIRIPIRDLLETVNLNILKQAVESNGIWGYSGARKAFFVDVMASRMEGHGIDKVFGEMELDEYLRFYDFVINGKTSCQNEDDVAEQFPILFLHFRICYLKKQGVRIASDLLMDYEGWFNQPEEQQFRENKMIRQAMRWCLFTYAIFSIDECFKVLEAVYPGQVNYESLKRYWLNVPYHASPEYLVFSRLGDGDIRVEDYAYDNRVIDASEAIDFRKIKREDFSPRKLPSNLQDFELTIVKSLNYSFHTLRPQDIDSMRDPWSHDRSAIIEGANYGIGLLRRSMSPEEASKKVLNKYDHWDRSNESKLRAYTDYLKRVENDVPLFLYYGFNRKEVKNLKIKSVILDRYTTLQQDKVAKKSKMTSAYSSSKRIK